jgi:DNA-directed RNA polymerase beta subunit
MSNKLNFLKLNFETIYDAYFNQKNSSAYPLVEHHINPMNNFLTNDVETILTDRNPIIKTYRDDKNGIFRKVEFNLKNLSIEKPQEGTLNKTPLYPNLCRVFNKSYTCNLYCDYTFKLYEQYDNKEIKVMVNLDSINSNKLKKLYIGTVPCMLMTKYCNLYGKSPDTLKKLEEDQDEYGGYFIINGQEFAIISQEHKASNFLYRNIEDNNHVVWIQSKRSGIFKYPYYILVKINNKMDLTVTIDINKKSKKSIPIKILYTALGIITDREIYNYIIGHDNKNENLDNIMRRNFENKDENIITQSDALLWIGRQMISNFKESRMSDTDIIEYVRIKLINERLFPHIEELDKTDGSVNLMEKILYLSYMIRNTIEFKFGNLKVTDRDNYGNKRIFTSANLFGQVLKYHFDTQLSEFELLLSKELETYVPEKNFKSILPRIIGGKDSKFKINNISINISKGEWPVGSTTQYSKSGGNTDVKDGVAQSLGRKSSVDPIDTLTKISAMIPKSGGGTLLSIHQLHNSQFGTIDPWNTPDGSSVGLVKHKTPWIKISENYNFDIILKLIKKHIPYILSVEDNIIVRDNFHELTKVIINGNIKFCIYREKRFKLLTDLKKLRRANILYRYISIILYHMENEIRIFTDSGRMLQCLLIVDKNNLRMSKEIFTGLKSGKYDWNSLLSGCGLPNKKPMLEYISIHEKEQNSIIAENYLVLLKGTKNLINYTHCLIDESSIIDLSSCQIPFANYNPAARVTYQNSMSKASIGTYVSNYAQRFDKRSYILQYPERAQVNTIGGKYTMVNRYPAGVNIRVAIMPYLGYSQEDSVIFNKNSIDNGLFSIYTYVTISDRKTSESEIYMKPNESSTSKYKINNSYAALTNNGHPRIGYTLKKGDIIIGKVRKIKENDKYISKRGRNMLYIDESITFKEEIGIVDSIIKTKNNKQEEILKIKIRINKRPVFGDKFASRIAQKGVNALIVPAYKLPYTENGERADLYFNPHGFTTRMTMSLPIELNLSDTGAKIGIIFDGTPFNGLKIEKDLITSMKKLGIKKNGNTIMYDGITGRQMKVTIAFGSIYYQRLKHLVSEKISYRADGRIVPMTKQPLAGRTIPGGGALKFGTMMNDAVCGFGTSITLREMLYDKSDKFSTFVSRKTGMLCAGNEQKGIYRDISSESESSGLPDVAKIDIPWTTIMLHYYTAMMGIGMKINVEDDKI